MSLNLIYFKIMLKYIPKTEGKYMEWYKLVEQYHELESDEDFKNIKISYNYNPIISDEVITLSVSNEVSALEINDRSFECFDIILNNTTEVIGGISFDYYNRNLEFGNVTYFVKEQFQNKGYATRALRLLIKLLKNNNFKGDKDLYFWVNYYNEYSKKVILNNGGEIISGGEFETKEKTGIPYMLRIKM